MNTPSDERLQMVWASSPTSVSEEIFLNNALLESGHAVTKKDWEFGDW